MVMLLAMFPGGADLHDSRDPPVSQMDGSTGIVDLRAMQKPGAACEGQKLTSADGARFGGHWTFFSLGRRADRGTCRTRSDCDVACATTGKMIVAWFRCSASKFIAGRPSWRAAIVSSGGRKPLSVRLEER